MHALYQVARLVQQLAKSKNVRERKAAMSRAQQEHHLREYLCRLGGFRVEGTGKDRFGLGDDQRGLTYNRNQTPSAVHEVGHALLTPVGQTLREHQRALAGLTSKRSTMPESERLKEETNAWRMEPMLYRRAGVPVRNNAYGSEDQLPRPTPEKREARSREAREVLAQFDAGTRRISPMGRVVQGTSLDAKINERAQRGGGFRR